MLRFPSSPTHQDEHRLQSLLRSDIFWALLQLAVACTNRGPIFAAIWTTRSLTSSTVAQATVVTGVSTQGPSCLSPFSYSGNYPWTTLHSNHQPHITAEPVAQLTASNDDASRLFGCALIAVSACWALLAGGILNYGSLKRQDWYAKKVHFLATTSARAVRVGAVLTSLLQPTAQCSLGAAVEALGLVWHMGFGFKVSHWLDLVTVTLAWALTSTMLHVILRQPLVPSSASLLLVQTLLVTLAALIITPQRCRDWAQTGIDAATGHSYSHTVDIRAPSRQAVVNLLEGCSAIHPHQKRLRPQQHSQPQLGRIQGSTTASPRTSFCETKSTGLGVLPVLRQAACAVQTVIECGTHHMDTGTCTILDVEPGCVLAPRDMTPLRLLVQYCISGHRAVESGCIIMAHTPGHDLPTSPAVLNCEYGDQHQPDGSIIRTEVVDVFWPAGNSGLLLVGARLANGKLSSNQRAVVVMREQAVATELQLLVQASLVSSPGPDHLATRNELLLDFGLWQQAVATTAAMRRKAGIDPGGPATPHFSSLAADSSGSRRSSLSIEDRTPSSPDSRQLQRPSSVAQSQALSLHTVQPGSQVQLCLANMAGSLLLLCCQRGLAATASYIVHHTMTAGFCTLPELLAFAEAGSSDVVKATMAATKLSTSKRSVSSAAKLSLLHWAVLSGNATMACEMASWPSRYCTDASDALTVVSDCPSCKWDTAGPQGLTPLHLVAGARDKGVMAAHVLKMFPETRNLWYTVLDEHSTTPAQVAQRAGLVVIIPEALQTEGHHEEEGEEGESQEPECPIKCSCSMTPTCSCDLGDRLAPDAAQVTSSCRRSSASTWLSWSRLSFNSPKLEQHYWQHVARGSLPATQIALLLNFLMALSAAVRVNGSEEERRNILVIPVYCTLQIIPLLVYWRAAATAGSAGRVRGMVAAFTACKAVRVAVRVMTALGYIMPPAFALLHVKCGVDLLVEAVVRPLSEPIPATTALPVMLLDCYAQWLIYQRLADAAGLSWPHLRAAAFGLLSLATLAMHSWRSRRRYVAAIDNNGTEAPELKAAARAVTASWT